MLRQWAGRQGIHDALAATQWIRNLAGHQTQQMWEYIQAGAQEAWIDATGAQQVLQYAVGA
eukprot:3437477-Prorocentrum_lima.AAC.1